MDTQRRKWFGTINNYSDHSLDPDKIVEIFNNLSSIKFWAMAEEIGLETQTPHIHFVVFSEAPIRHSTMRNAFNGKADIEPVKSSIADCVEYIKKEGKHADTEKADTTVEGSFKSQGTPPIERQGRRTDMTKIVEMVEDGASNEEIRFFYPSQFLRYQSHIERTRQEIKEELYRNTFRELSVVYIWGKPNTGKTRYVLEKYGYENVCHITNYKNPMNFDKYNRSQDVLCLDEYASQLPLFALNGICDGFPCTLPARYADKVACYTKVYIISNIDLKDQYENMRNTDIFGGLIRRITSVIHFLADGKYHEYTDVKAYIDGSENWTPLPQDTPTPFDTPPSPPTPQPKGAKHG